MGGLRAILVGDASRWVVAVEWREYAEQMALLARDLLGQESVQATLAEIAAAVKLVDGCDAAGILAVRKGRAVTLAACGDMVSESDHLQGDLGEGPCFDLARRTDGERLYRIADMTRPQPTWPRFAAQARKLGDGSGVASSLRRVRSAAAVRDGHDRVAVPMAQGRAGVRVHSPPAVGTVVVRRPPMPTSYASG